MKPIYLIWHNGRVSEADTALEVMYQVWDKDGRPARDPLTYMSQVTRRVETAYRTELEVAAPGDFVEEMAMLSLCRILRWPDRVAIDRA